MVLQQRMVYADKEITCTILMLVNHQKLLALVVHITANFDISFFHFWLHLSMV